MQLNTLWLTKNALTYYWNYLAQDSSMDAIVRLEYLWQALQLAEQGAHVFNGMGLEGGPRAPLIKRRAVMAG